MIDERLKHVAIIMDGNRRWAAARGKPALYGHRKGAVNLERIAQAAMDLKIETMTVFAFSTENWNRSQKEIEGLLFLFKQFLRRKIAKMQQKGISLKFIGNLKAFSLSLQTLIKEAVEQTKEGENLRLVVALNYGGRDEIVRACQAITQKMDKEKGLQITDKMISNELDTAQWSDPDLIIRTSGEKRVSNFLLWQSCYAELLFTETFWPDFDYCSLREAVEEYQRRQRRIGR